MKVFPKPATAREVEEIKAEQITQDATIALNAAKISADGSIDTHSDVDVTTTAPVVGDLLGWDGSNFVPQSTDNGYTIFSIWAEESGGLVNNNRQWSFGNGATGNINIVLPIDAEMFAVSFDCETAAAQVSMEVMQDDVATFVTKTFSAKDFETLSTPIQFTAGQCVGFRTDIEVVAATDARVAAWFRVRSTPASTSVLNDLLDVSAGGITSGQILQWNGSNFVNVDLGATSVGLGNVDNTSDADKPVSAAQQAALDLKADANHTHVKADITDFSDADYATATQGALADTALQSGDIDTLAEVNALITDATLIDTADPRLSDARTPTAHTHVIADITDASTVAASNDYNDLDNLPTIPDVSNFETTTQLNARDVANRDRSNHTGTQTASTISDFDTEVSNNTDVVANTNHSNLTNNPHSVTQTQVGLGNVDNTSDLNKPVSNATQAALNALTISTTSTNVFRANLNSATQDTNDATFAYTWADSTETSTDVTQDAGDRTRATFAVGGKCFNVSAFLQVTDATANDRAAFHISLSHFSSTGTLKRKYDASSTYVRDDSAAFDSGSAFVNSMICVEVGDYIQVTTTRLDSQDATDDNPANQTLSYLQMERIDYNIS